MDVANRVSVDPESVFNVSPVRSALQGRYEQNRQDGSTGSCILDHWSVLRPLILHLNSLTRLITLCRGGRQLASQPGATTVC